MNNKTVYTFITGLTMLILSIIILRPVNVYAYETLYSASADSINSDGAIATSTNLSSSGFNNIITNFPNTGTATQFRWRVKRLQGAYPDLNMYVQVRQYPFVGSGTNCVAYLSNTQETGVLVSDYNSGVATSTFLVSTTTQPSTSSYNCNFSAGATYHVYIGSLLTPATSTQFSIQDIFGRVYLEIGGAGGLSPIVGAVTATSSLDTLETYKSSSCVPYPSFLGGSFSLVDCMGYLFVWHDSVAQATVSSLQTNLLTVFPIGYITDFVSIISSSATTSLPTISATIPPGVIGAGATITLNPTHVLDFVLNATTTGFNNSSASSTETFFTITNRYWSYFLYILALIYIVGRILGTNLISSPFQEMSGQQGVSDESYRLKEKLYELSQRDKK